MGTIGRSEFLDLLTEAFPENAAEVQAEGGGLLHLEAAAFRKATERAMDAGRFCLAEKHFRFVERVRREASPDVENALGISYLVDLALGVCTPERYRAVKKRMPKRMREEMAGIHENWR